FPPCLPDPRSAICADGAGAGLRRTRPRFHRRLQPIPLQAFLRPELSRSRALPKAPRYGAAPPCASQIPYLLPGPARAEALCASCHGANAVVSGPGVEFLSFPRLRPLPLLRQRNQKHRGGITFESDIYESRLHTGQHFHDAAFINVADYALVFIAPFNVE